MVLGEKIKRAVAALGLAVALAGAPKKAEADTIEVMAGHQKTKIDVELNIELAPRLGMYNKNKLAIAYDNTAAYNGVAQIAYDAYRGLGPVIGANLAKDGVAPGGGAQYFGVHGDLAVLGQALAGYHKGLELTGLAKLRFRPKLTENLKLYTELEALCIANTDGLAYGVQKLLAGLDIKGIQFGAAAELEEIGPKAELGYNIGGFIQKEF